QHPGPKEKEERGEIVKQMRELIDTGTTPKEWLKDLANRFEKLPAIKKLRHENGEPSETFGLLYTLVAILSRPELTQKQRTVVLDAFNHITCYNVDSKKMVFKSAKRYHDVFKALASSISSTRPEGVPSNAVKGSFEADWLSNTSVAERYNRFLLVGEQPGNLIPSLKVLARKFDQINDVTIWTHPDGTPSEIQLIMRQVLALFKEHLDYENRVYADEVVRYISSVNKDAFDLMVTQLEDKEYMVELLGTWVEEHGNNLMESLSSGFLEIRLLTGKLSPLVKKRVGPTLERKLLDMVIPSDSRTVTLNLKELKEDIINSGDAIMDPRADPGLPLSAENLLRRAITGLLETKETESLEMEFQRSCYMKMIAYLERWKAGLRHEIHRYLETEPGLIPIVSAFCAHHLHVSSKETRVHTWYSRIIQGTRYEELVERHEVLSQFGNLDSNPIARTFMWKNNHPKIAAKMISELPTEWWSPLYPKARVKEILDWLVGCLNKTERKLPNAREAHQALELLWHILSFNPNLRTELLAAIHNKSNYGLRSWLRSYLREEGRTSEFENIAYTSTIQPPRDLLHWLSKIESLQRDEVKPVTTWVQSVATIAATVREKASETAGNLSRRIIET
ncbi:hypothetical protein CROQUDRAFT_46597, partial [Cronartium quercuum f. sp. fusiforme G11]